MSYICKVSERSGFGAGESERPSVWVDYCIHAESST
jgi:hypothetical protein